MEGIDDVRFLRDVIGDLAGEAAIDGRRVDLSGSSNGGDIVHIAACQLADSLAAPAWYPASPPIRKESAGRPGRCR